MSRRRQIRPSIRYSLSPDRYSRRPTSMSRVMSGRRSSMSASSDGGSAGAGSGGASAGVTTGSPWGSGPPTCPGAAATWARYNLTSAVPIGFRPSLPAKMTSSMRSPRRLLALCSPRTHVMASMTLLLPQPLGPTMAVTPSSNTRLARSGKLLKPEMASCCKRIGFRTSKKPPENGVLHHPFSSGWERCEKDSTISRRRQLPPALPGPRRLPGSVPGARPAGKPFAPRKRSTSVSPGPPPPPRHPAATSATGARPRETGSRRVAPAGRRRRGCAAPPPG